MPVSTLESRSSSHYTFYDKVISHYDKVISYYDKTADCSTAEALI